MELKNNNTSFVVATRLIFAILISVLSALPLTPSIAGDYESLISEIEQLDQQTITTSEDLYKDLARTNPVKIKTIQQLDELVASRINKNNNLSALIAIYSNTDILLENYDSSHIFKLLDTLLNHNGLILARRILDEIETYGDKSLIANTHFIFAKYYAKRNNWEKVYKLLKDNQAELTKDNSAYSYLLTGVALQHMKKHREAMGYYQNVPDDSRFYSHAQLNIATASVRQGWWTDAELIIKELIEKDSSLQESNFFDRLHIVLGYALLDHEFYRNAREEFRDVSIDGVNTNNALLGIALTAINQGDYVGGLNALTILKKKKTHDLSVEESHLLLPYVYSQLKQDVTVRASYREAINYYQRKIASLQSLISKASPASNIDHDLKNNIFYINNNVFKYKNKFPDSFLNNYYLIKDLSTKVPQGVNTARIHKLIKAYENTLDEITRNLIKARIQNLKSYLSQSRYGLAKVYDTNSGEKQ